MPSDPFPFPFGMSQFTTEPWSFEEDLARYPDLGVETIEVCEAKLDDGDDPERFDAQMALLRASGLPVCAVQAKVRTFFASALAPEIKEVRERVAHLRASIERLAPHTPGAVFVTNTGAAPGGNVAEVIEVVTRELRALGPFAADHGVRIAIEPLNPTLMNGETAIWTLAQGRAIVEAVDHPAIGLDLDLWNVWQNADLEAEIARAGERIFLLEASDWRTPRSGGDRHLPGEGEIPLGPLMRAVHRAGYQGACVVEIFSDGVPDSVYDRDLNEVVRQSRAGLERAWNGAA